MKGRGAQSIGERQAYANGVARGRAEVQENSPDDIRALGWAVAIHNDYRQFGMPCTFWLFTKGDRAVKGEGASDAEALNKVRAVLAPPRSTVAPEDDA